MKKLNQGPRVRACVFIYFIHSTTNPPAWQGDFRLSVRNLSPKSFAKIPAKKTVPRAQKRGRPETIKGRPQAFRAFNNKTESAESVQLHFRQPLKAFAEAPSFASAMQMFATLALESLTCLERYELMLNVTVLLTGSPSAE